MKVTLVALGEYGVYIYLDPADAVSFWKPFKRFNRGILHTGMCDEVCSLLHAG
jgi:hypothetical protein